MREDSPGRRPRHPGRRGRLPRLLHHRRRPGQDAGESRDPAHQDENLHCADCAGHRRRRPAANALTWRIGCVLRGRQHPLRERPPTADCPTGAPCSATPSSQPPSWTGSCTTPSCSTSKAPAGGYANTTALNSPPPPRPRPANLNHTRPAPEPPTRIRLSVNHRIP